MLFRNLLIRFAIYGFVFAINTCAHSMDTPTQEGESSSHQDTTEITPELGTMIATLAPTTHLHQFGTYTDYKSLFNLRLVSKDWKTFADDVITRGKFLSLPLRPTNYEKPGLEGLAPLGSTIYLAGWNESTSDKIRSALSVQKFPNVIKILCIGSGGSTLISEEIGTQGCISLANGLQQFSKLKELYIDRHMGEKGGEAMGIALKHLPKLEIISIKGTMGPLGTKKFIEGLTYTPNLISLNLWGNGVGDIGCMAVADKLEHLKNLTSLDLSVVLAAAPGGQSKFIQAAGAKHLAEQLHKYGTKLKYLSITGHSLGTLGTQSLQEALSKVNGKLYS